MPTKPLKQCTFPGCPNFVKSGRCAQHAFPPFDRSKFKRTDTRNSGQRGYDQRWQNLRAVKISRDPLCESCMSRGISTPAKTVHHIQSIASAPELRLTMDNLESLCWPCHNRKHGRAAAVKVVFTEARTAYRYVNGVLTVGDDAEPLKKTKGDLDAFVKL